MIEAQPPDERKAVRPVVQPATEIARRAAYDRLPRVKITDLLLEVDAWTGFSECFIHRRSGREADDRNALLTVILADGINLGLTRMAETCRGASLRQLAHLHDWHISEAAYGEALGRLIDAHRAMPLAALWGDGTTSSSDGQQFHAGGRGAAIGDINARSGNEPGVAFYTHVSDRYDPFASRVIAATAGEAPYVLDGLLYHQTGLTIEEHYTDTGGASDHVFGLMPFFGYRFAPRLRDIKERRLHLLPGQDRPLLTGMTAEPIALGHVATHWDELAVRHVAAPAPSLPAMLRRLVPIRDRTDWPSRYANRRPNARFSCSTGCATSICPAHPGGPARANATRARAIFFNQLGNCAIVGSRTRPIVPPASAARRRHHLVEHPLSRNGARGHRHAPMRSPDTRTRAARPARPVLIAGMSMIGPIRMRCDRCAPSAPC
jgi:hypothetical protein